MRVLTRGLPDNQNQLDCTWLPSVSASFNPAPFALLTSVLTLDTRQQKSALKIAKIMRHFAGAETVESSFDGTPDNIALIRQLGQEGDGRHQPLSQAGSSVPWDSADLCR